MKESSSRLEPLMQTSLFVVAILVRLALMGGTGFDGLYGQDSFAYYDFAQGLHNGLLNGDIPSGFFWPVGYPALLVIAFTLFGQSIGVAQAFTLLVSALLGPLMYAILRQLGTQRLAACAGGLTIIVCGQLNQSSLVVMSDVPALFWGMLSLWYLLKHQHKPTTLHVVLACTYLACATMTRWTYGLLFVPTIVSVMVNRHTIRWPTLILALGLASGIIGLQFLISQQYDSPGVNHAFVEGWRIQNALAAEVRTSEGVFHFSEPNLRFYASPLLDTYYLSPLLLIWLVLGVYQLRCLEKSNLILVVGAWLPYFFLIGIPQQNIRYGLMLFPVVAILVGLGVDWMAQRRWPAIVYAVFVVLFCAGLVQGAQTGSQVIQQFITRHQQDKHTAAWIAEQIPDQSTVFAFGFTLTLQHYTPLEVKELYYESAETLAQSDLDNAYLVVNEWNLETQWIGTETYRAYTWLRDERGLNRIGRNGNFTLFQIGTN
jgi:hypothetical protein